MREMDYCAIRSMCGPEIADEIFGRRLPVGFDLDQPGDLTMIEGVIRDQDRCTSCPQATECFDGA